MSNFDRAVKALNDVDEAIGHLADNEAYVTALEAEGLLMPDLPEPTPNKYDPDADPYWKVRIKQGDQMTVTSSSCDSICVAGLGTANVTGARTLALALLAAADYAEKEQGNE